VKTVQFSTSLLPSHQYSVQVSRNSDFLLAAMVYSEEKLEEEEEEEEEEEANGTVVIEVTTPLPFPHDLQKESCICVSTSDIQSWDLHHLMQSSSLTIRAQRSRHLSTSFFCC
jgi:hypothetical protein